MRKQGVNGKIGAEILEVGSRQLAVRRKKLGLNYQKFGYRGVCINRNSGIDVDVSGCFNSQFLFYQWQDIKRFIFCQV